jgi:hypothetical protein
MGNTLDDLKAYALYILTVIDFFYFFPNNIQNTLHYYYYSTTVLHMLHIKAHVWHITREASLFFNSEGQRLFRAGSFD